MTTEITFNKTELIAQLKAAFEEVRSLVSPLSDEQLHASNTDKWSIGGNLEHLILTSLPVSSALKLDKEKIKGFGIPKGSSRTYEHLFATYKKALAKGIKAPPSFSPQINKPKSKQESLASWDVIEQKFLQRIDALWTEEELETYAIPHPAIGILTVREMLYFTVFHIHHHLEAMRKLG